MPQARYVPKEWAGRAGTGAGHLVCPRRIMPIRINLLAEAQAAAEMRRKDPVKRGIWVGSFLVCVVVLWIAKLQLDIFFEKSSYHNVEADWKGMMAKYSTVTNEQSRIMEVERKLAQLDRLSTNRFLWAPVFNALQQTMVDDVQVTRLTGNQTYAKAEGHDVGSGSNRHHVPEAMIENVSLTIEAKDLKPNEQSYTKFKESLCNFDFFVKRLGRRDGFVMDGTLGLLTVDPVDPSRQFVTFTLASHFPEARRDE
jgi:hypothetical protein